MREIAAAPASGPLFLPEYLTQHSDGQFIQLLFNSLSSAALYLDQWGRICSANNKAKELFFQDELLGKTVLEFLLGWENPIHCHKEVLLVAKTGRSMIGAIERAVIQGEEHWFQTNKVAIQDEENDINGVLLTLDDITKVKKQEVNLQHSEARYRAFIENSQDAIWRFDIEPPIPVDLPEEEIANAILERATLGDCNHVFAKIYGESHPEKLKGVSLSETGSHVYIMDAEAFVNDNFRLNSQEIPWLTDSGEYFCLQASANGTVENGQLIEIWGITRDITERQQQIERLEYQASHDMLTGLPNRVKLKSMADTMIAAKAIEQESLALIIIDLDSFKEINGTLGHNIGDRIIKEVGTRIQTFAVKFRGAIARLGGDEFAIFLPNIKNSRHARGLADEVLSSIRKDFLIDNTTIALRASLGIALYPSQAKDFTTLMRYADVAMYMAKQEMSGIEIYDPKTDQHSPKRLSLMSDLGKAIRENQLTLYYQPKIDLKTQKVVGVEALLRWIHPTMGFVSPAEFIPIAEMTDIINEVTEWVLNESLQQVRRWREKGMDLKVAINISARNLLNDTVVEKIEYLLHRYELAPSCLELEITESAIMNNADRSLKILEEINNLGVDLSVLVPI